MDNEICELCGCAHETLLCTGTYQPDNPVDTRPRALYLLPSGEAVRVVLDHGETPAPTVSYSIGGKLVVARLIEQVTQGQVDGVLEALRMCNCPVSHAVVAAMWVELQALRKVRP
ncbi:MAG TPA: hypothetical protein VLN57_20840 [Xanthobacteraceae bacterium]|nr:hypothetical protein [Xanthobacteraceae bacterium]